MVVLLRWRVLPTSEREGRAGSPDRGHAECQAGGLEGEAQEAGGGDAEPPEEEGEQSGGQSSHHGRESGQPSQH